MPPNTPEYRTQLMQEGRHVELFQAFQEMLETHPDDPNLLYNLGLSAYNAGQFAKAATYLKQLKARMPQDLKARAKLVQVYEALENFGDRDAERDELLALVSQQKDDPKRPVNYCRDQFAVGDWFVQVTENFELIGDMAVRHTFHIFRAGEQKPAFQFSLGSYEHINRYMRESGTLQSDERVFHLDGYSANGHSALGFFKGEPPYNIVKNAVQDILRQSQVANMHAKTETIPGSELEDRMRPGAYSSAGFLGATESLDAVLRQDELTLQKLGISYEQISAELEKILGEALQQKTELMRANPQEFREREKYPTQWRKQPVPIYSLDNLPSPSIGYLVENIYQVFFIQYRGSQECPWKCKRDAWSSFDFLLLNRQTGGYIIAPGLIAHLIRAHRFFEGNDSPYRVEPLKLVQVLGLAS